MIKQVININYRLICDICGKEYSSFGNDDFDYEDEVYDKAHEDGWKYTKNGKDVCDKCVERIKKG